MIEQTGGAFELLGEPIDTGALVGMAVAKDNVQLAEALRAAAQEVIDSGEYHKVLERWGVPHIAIDTVVVNVDHGAANSDEQQ